MTTAKKTPDDSPEEKVTPTKKGAVDSSPAQYIQFLTGELFEALINLQSYLKAEYNEMPDNPSLVIQIKAVSSASNILKKVFPHAAAPD